MKRVLLPAGVAVVLMLSACGSDAPVGTNTRELPTTTATAAPRTATTTRASGSTTATDDAPAGALRRVTSAGYAFDLARGSWSAHTTDGGGTDERREFVDESSGTLLQVVREPARPGETAATAAARVRRNFAANGKPGRVRAVELDGEPAVLSVVLAPSPDAEERPALTLVALRDGYLYGLTVIGTNRTTATTLRVADRAVRTWRWQ